MRTFGVSNRLAHKGLERGNPYFIGVFDAVASLGSYRLSVAMVARAAAFLLLASGVLSVFALCPHSLALRGPHAGTEQV